MEGVPRRIQQGRKEELRSEFEPTRVWFLVRPLVYYNLAVVRVKQQRVDDAFMELEKAMGKGFSGYAEMERDPDLNPLRKDERYQARRWLPNTRRVKD